MCLEQCHQVLVHQSTIHHGHHLEHRGVGDAPAAHHLALDAQGGGYLGGTPSAAMHQHLVVRDGGEAGEQGMELLVVLDHGTAHFYDNDG